MVEDVPKFDDIRRQLRQAIAESERETKRLRAALEHLDALETRPSSQPARRRIRRPPQELARLRALVAGILTMAGGQTTARDVHLVLVDRKELEDTKQDLEVTRNLLRGLVKDEQVDEQGRGNYKLRVEFSQTLPPPA